MVNLLKPNLWKLVLTLALFLLSSAVWRAYVISHISDTFPLGFPFQFYLAWGPCPPGQTCSEFKGLFLILDFLVWYLVSALLVGRLRRSA